MITSLKTQVLSLSQLRTLARYGWEVGVNASLKYVHNAATNGWELVPWENMVRSDRPCVNTLTGNELLERMPRHSFVGDTLYSLHVAPAPHGWIVNYCTAEITGRTIGSTLARPTLKDAAFDALLEILKRTKELTQ